MIDQWWSWVLGIIGLVGFILAGQKVWWSWYVNLMNQGFWFAYSILTEQYGFLVVTIAYTVVFAKNAYSWTKEHFNEEPEKPTPSPAVSPNFHRQAAGLPESDQDWCPGFIGVPRNTPAHPNCLIAWPHSAHPIGIVKNRPSGASIYGWCQYRRSFINSEPYWHCVIHDQPSRHKVATSDSMLPCLEMDPYPTEELQEYADADRNHYPYSIEFRGDQPEDRPKRSVPPRGPDGRFIKKPSD